MSYYVDYVNHMLRFFARYPEMGTFKNSIDERNWRVVKKVLDELPEEDKNVIIEVYRRGDTIADNIYHISKELGIRQNSLWTIVKTTTKRIAEERELI